MSDRKIEPARLQVSTDEEVHDALERVGDVLGIPHRSKVASLLLRRALVERPSIGAQLLEPGDGELARVLTG